MRNLTRTLAAAAVAALLVVPAIETANAGSGGFEDSFAECHYPKAFDLMIMCPVGLVAIGLGFTMFLPYGPIAALTTPDGAGQPWNAFVMEPVRFTFGRPLGECSAQAHDL
jgi:hypothetical protein